MRLFAGTPFDQPPKCSRCGSVESDCTCPKFVTYLPPNEQVARLSVEKRKKGKVVTVVRGLAADDNDLPALLARLKSQCGAGGTIDNDSLEIQGSHIERIGAVLRELGYRLKT